MTDARTCVRCGAVGEGAALLLWSTESSAGTSSGEAVVQWYCDACSRENIRSIEAKLDERYW